MYGIATEERRPGIDTSRNKVIRTSWNGRELLMRSLQYRCLSLRSEQNPRTAVTKLIIESQLDGWVDLLGPIVNRIISTALNSHNHIESPLPNK